MPLTMLCIATYRKGDDVPPGVPPPGLPRAAPHRREAARRRLAARRDRRVLLRPPRHARGRHPRRAPRYLARTERLDRIVALDDFDVETAAMLREYLHVPGHGRDDGRGRFATSSRCAPARGQRGDPLPGIRPRVSTMRPSPSGPHADHAALGPEAALAGGGDRHQHDRLRRRAVARSSTRSATRGRITCSSSSSPATSITSTRSSSIGRVVFATAEPLRHAADGRRARRRASS